MYICYLVVTPKDQLSRLTSRVCQKLCSVVKLSLRFFHLTGTE